MKNILTNPIRNLLFATALGLAPCHALAASASELLEKGIYTEETKGELDAAIAIYQQILAAAKDSQALAAQAQFRLGLCYLKKNRTAEAMAAFEKIVRDYPDEKELVAKARGHLPTELALLPVPWVDGERLHVTFALGNIKDIGASEYRAVLTEAAGRQVWQVGARTYANGNSLSRVEVDTETFQPISSTWKHVLLGEASVRYRPGEAEITRVGKEPSKVLTDKAVYDNEQTVHLMRRLPLAVGYKVMIPIISSLGGAAVLPIEFEVLAKEDVEVPAGKFECFKVKLSVGQTFWFSTDAHRYPVKFEAGGATGTLTSIAYAKAGELGRFRDDTLGVSFTTPPDWVTHRQHEEKPGKQRIHLLDADAIADGAGLFLTDTEKLTSAQRAGARAWAEDFLADAGKQKKDLKVRPASWQAWNVSGRAGVGCVADYVEKETPMVLLAVHALGAKTSEHFFLACPADKLAALQPAFQGIIASYRATK